jgi:hypothetical protein
VSSSPVRQAAKAALHRALTIGPVRRVASAAVNGLRATDGLSKLGRKVLTEYEAEREAKKAINLVTRRDAPYVAGPWCSEVGYELLYWIPFLRWAVETHPGLKTDLMVISRGGTGDWYAGIGARYADIFDFVDPDTFRAGRERATVEGKRKKQKQYDISSFDADVAARVAASRGVSDYGMLHPSAMYEMLRVLGDRGALARFDQVARYEQLARPSLGELDGLLPDDYVAVKFYFNYPLPATDQNAARVRAIVEHLARHSNVVLLNTGMTFDEHHDFDPETAARIHRFDALMTPANNLRIQSAIISRARAFVGTYGGLSYLPPFYGVPSVSFYSDWTRFAHHHLALAQRTFRGPGWGHFLALDVNEAPLLHLAQGAVDQAVDLQPGAIA